MGEARPQQRYEDSGEFYKRQPREVTPSPVQDGFNDGYHTLCESLTGLGSCFEILSHV